jgi:hypothetical protein
VPPHEFYFAKKGRPSFASEDIAAQDIRRHMDLAVKYSVETIRVTSPIWAMVGRQAQPIVAEAESIA